MSEEDSTQNQAKNTPKDDNKTRSERENRREEDLNDDEDDSKNKPIAEDRTDDSDKPKGKNILENKNDEQLDVPQVTINCASRTNAVEQKTEVLTDDQSIQVPQMQIQSPGSLNTEQLVGVVEIGSEAFEIDVPQFRLDTKHRIKSVELDENELEGLKRVQEVQIPQVRLEDSDRIYPLSNFLDTIPKLNDFDTEIKENVVEEEISEEAEQKATAQKIDDESLGALKNEGGSSWAENEAPDFLELLFGSRGPDIKSKNPMIILVEGDVLIGAVETLLKRRYREIEGGEPDSLKISTAEGLTNEERWISADGKIFTTLMNNDEWEKLVDEHQDDWQSILGNRIDQLFSGQKFGAIIFNSSNLPDPEMISVQYHPPRVVEIEEQQDWNDVASIFFPTIDDGELSKWSFSQLFDWNGNGIAQDRQREVLSDLDRKFAFATEDDDSASDEHYYLKAFVVKWLVEKLWESEDEFISHDDIADIDYMEVEEVIQTERTLKTKDMRETENQTEQTLKTNYENMIRPDVQYGSQVFEVEMFFGEAGGSGVTSKLQKTIRKYENISFQVDTVNVIVDNLTCILHLKELAQFKRNHKDWEENHIDINLYTINLWNEELVPVNEIVNKISENTKE